MKTDAGQAVLSEEVAVPWRERFLRLNPVGVAIAEQGRNFYRWPSGVDIGQARVELFSILPGPWEGSVPNVVEWWQGYGLVVMGYSTNGSVRETSVLVAGKIAQGRKIDFELVNSLCSWELEWDHRDQYAVQWQHPGCVRMYEALLVARATLEVMHRR